MTVTRQHVQLDTGVVVVSAPKSRASSRTVAVPAAILPAIRAQIESLEQAHSDGTDTS